MTHDIPLVIDTIEIQDPVRSFPDIDIDAGVDLRTGKDRNAIIDYIIDKYGEDYVAQVGTIGTYHEKSVIRTLGKIYDIPLEMINRCTKGFDSTKSFEENLHESQDVRLFFSKYPALRDKVNHICGEKEKNGAISNVGIHAGGVVISDRNRGLTLDSIIPLQKTKDKGKLATAFTKEQVGKLGLIKYDVLGLITATIVHRAKEMIGYDPYRNFYEDGEDHAVFEHIVKKGKHKNIFQFDSELGRRAFLELKPMNIMELSNASGLIRIMGSPEGLAVYNTYRKNVNAALNGRPDEWIKGLREQIVDDRIFNAAKKVLEESYGVLIYQEQLAGLVEAFSGGEKNFTDGNNTRKNLNDHSKKFGKIATIQGDVNAITAWHKAFMSILDEYFLPYLGKDGRESDNKIIQDFLACRLTDKGRLPIPPTGVINWLITASSYLFSKLHSIAYSVNTYDQMYIKHYYPIEFWAVTLDSAQGKYKEIVVYTQNMKAEYPSIKLLPPNINTSKKYCVPDRENNTIGYGLGALKRVGKAVDHIIDEREANGPYQDVADFLARVKGKKVKKQAIEGLLYANAFSDFGDLEAVYRDLVKTRKTLNPLLVSKRERIEKEAEITGTNMSFMHPLQIQAPLCPSVFQIASGDTKSVIVKVLDVTSRITRMSREPYLIVTCQCQRSFREVSIFDFKNGHNVDWKENTYRRINVKRVDQYFHLDSSYR